MKSLSLEYNSTRNKLILSEYGRSIQKLIEHAKTIQDKDKRTIIISEIVELIHQLNPQTKNVLEFKQKLWRHVYKMAGYDLDVQYPYGEIPTEDDNVFKPQRVPYPQHSFPMRHYGHNIRVMIEKALQMEDGAVKKGYIESILSYMKLSYRTWNKEHFVSDDIIISDFMIMSKNQLNVDDDHTINISAKNLSSPSSSNPKNIKRKGKPGFKGQPQKNQRNN